MPTNSIKKNIIIRDKKSAVAFVEALEKATAIAETPPPCNYSVRELKGSKNIRDFFKY